MVTSHDLVSPEDAEGSRRGQLIDDWDERYAGETVPPWQDLAPNLPLVELVERVARQARVAGASAQLVELGAGLGSEALELARRGWSVLATDLSPRAVARCRARAAEAGLELRAAVLDVFAPPADWVPCALIYDKGCWHTVFEPAARARFAARVAELLRPGGLWVSALGSAETPDDPSDPARASYPRWREGEVRAAAGERFEVLELRSGTYAHAPGLDFLTWEAVLRRR